VLTDGHDRTMVSDWGANHELRPADVQAAFDAMPDLRHVHVSGYTLLDETSRPAGLMALQLARGLPTSVDAASATPLRSAGRFLDWIADAGLLLANLDEARVLASTMDGSASAEEVASALSRTVPEVVVKLGAGGAVWAGGGDVRTVPAHPATVVDTTGAGDAFAAGFISARVAGAQLDGALAQAVRLGASAVGLVGGRPPRA